jgi:hypothetical protein
LQRDLGLTDAAQPDERDPVTLFLDEKLLSQVEQGCIPSDETTVLGQRNVMARQGGMVRETVIDLFPEPADCIRLALAVYRRHEDGKNALKTVRPVFFASGLAVLRPLKALVDVKAIKRVPAKRRDGDASYVVNLLLQGRFIAKQCAIP